MIIRDIVAAAAPLRERLAGGYRPLADEANSDNCASLSQKWALLLSKDDPGSLARRLAFEDFDSEKASQLIGGVVLDESEPLPIWAEIFEAARAEAGAMPVEDWEQSADAPRWDAFYRPFIRVARRMLIGRIGDSALSADAVKAFEQALRERMVFSARPLLELEFSVSQAVVGSSDSKAPSRAEFCRDCFVADYFFSSHPALARLLGLAVEYWLEAIVEFFERFAADEEEIRRTFFSDQESLGIEAVSASLSDPHRRGRNVVILTLTGGRRLVYKPRSLGLEVAYFDLIAWLNALPDCTPGSAMHTVRCLDRGDYGWMEWVSHEDCPDETGLSLYFERAGAVLALIYALAGSDMHYENIIAHGDHPVPVDLEVLMVPARIIVDDSTAGEATMVASLALLGSVRSVGLLPEWLPVRKGEIYNAGGLGAVLSEKEENGEPKPNLPSLAGRSISSHLYRAQIIAGFEQMYRRLAKQRDTILAPEGPLEKFKGRIVRFINRATNLYARILMKSAKPGALTSGVVRSFEFEILMKNVLSVEEKWFRGARDVTVDEIVAMERGDIPFFQARVDNLDLILGETGGLSKSFFSRTGYDAARDRLYSFSEADLAVQLGLIRMSFDLIGNNKLIPVGQEPSTEQPVAFAAPSFEEEAVSLAREICTSAIWAGESVTWIAPQMIPGSESFQLRPVTESLYDGTFGVLLFLLAVAKNYDEKESGRVARAIVESFRKDFAKVHHRNILAQKPVGLTGLGGCIHSLLLASTLAKDTGLIELAVEVAGFLDETAIGKDTTFDIIGGVAGAIPALLNLHTATGDSRWLQRATACGERLLATRGIASNDLRSWRCPNKFLSGYSHGASGIAASLLRLHSATGDVRYQEAAQEAIAYENTLFVPEENNWLDIRNDRKVCMNAWCHGAAGVALGRVLGGNAGRDLEDALQTTAGFPPSFIDQACCGNSGRADVLVSAAGRLGRPELLDSARALMSETTAVAHSRGGYACYGTLPRSVRGPGFFQGLSGIGYTLARIEDPTLPSVLAMEL